MADPQILSQATNDCIIAIEQSIAASIKVRDLEMAQGLLTPLKYKAVMDSIRNREREILVLKGELPAKKRKIHFRGGMYT